MTYNSEVSAAVFAKLASGQMIIEPRLNDPAHRKIKPSDLILFVNRETREERLAKVVGLLRFDSFKELFNAYPAERFGGEDDQQLLRGMRKFYSADQELEHGVLGIKLHLLKKS
jgi:ASC-1-like (ASCH) protein